MKKVKASVIIPYFKKKNNIKKTIRSAISQSYTDLEIILIYDDEDKSDLAYLNNIKKLDKRIKIIVNKKNLGAGESRNVGIKNSKGKFICFLDADDIWKKNKLLFQINLMIKEKSLISHTTYEIRNSKNNITGVRKAKNFYNYKELLPSCDIGLSTVVAEKKIFNKNIRFSKQKTKEDFVLWLKILKKNIKIIGINKNLASWHLTENSLSSSTLQKIKDAFLVYYKHMDFNLIKSIYYTLILSINFMKKRFADK